MNTTNKILYFFIAGLLLQISGTYEIIKETKQQLNVQNINNFQSAVVQPCRNDNEWARKNVELLISQKDWAPERQETGTIGLSVSQIQLLDKQKDSEACQFFNNRYKATISKQYEANNEPVYHVVYYKVKEFYFVSIVLAQPTDPDVVTTGLSYIIIFDNNLNKLAGYSF